MFARRVWGCGKFIGNDVIQHASVVGVVVCVSFWCLFCFVCFLIFVATVMGNVACVFIGLYCFCVRPYGAVQSWCFGSFGLMGVVFVLLRSGAGNWISVSGC